MRPQLDYLNLGTQQAGLSLKELVCRHCSMDSKETTFYGNITATVTTAMQTLAF